MLNKEIVTSSEIIYSGKVLTVRKDSVIACNNKVATRDIVCHNGGVGIVAVTDDKKVCLVRQYRVAIGDFLTEIPAGKLEAGEEHSEAAVRELSEETGYTADKMTYLGFIYVSPGYCTEKIHIYMASGLKAGECSFDEDEDLEVIELDIKDAVQMVMSGELTDAKTVYGILKVNNILEGE